MSGKLNGREFTVDANHAQKPRQIPGHDFEQSEKSNGGEILRKALKVAGWMKRLKEFKTLSVGADADQLFEDVVAHIQAMDSWEELLQDVEKRLKPAVREYLDRRTQAQAQAAVTGEEETEQGAPSAVGGVENEDERGGEPAPGVSSTEIHIGRGNVGQDSQVGSIEETVMPKTQAPDLTESQTEATPSAKPRAVEQREQIKKSKYIPQKGDVWTKPDLKTGEPGERIIVEMVRNEGDEGTVVWFTEEVEKDAPKGDKQGANQMKRLALDQFLTRVYSQEYSLDAYFFEVFNECQTVFERADSVAKKFASNEDREFKRNFDAIEVLKKIGGGGRRYADKIATFERRQKRIWRERQVLKKIEALSKKVWRIEDYWDMIQGVEDEWDARERKVELMLELKKVVADMSEGAVKSSPVLFQIWKEEAKAKKDEDIQKQGGGVGVIGGRVKAVKSKGRLAWQDQQKNLNDKGGNIRGSMNVRKVGEHNKRLIQVEPIGEADEPEFLTDFRSKIDSLVEEIKGAIDEGKWRKKPERGFLLTSDEGVKSHLDKIFESNDRVSKRKALDYLEEKRQELNDYWSQNLGKRGDNNSGTRDKQFDPEIRKGPSKTEITKAFIAFKKKVADLIGEKVKEINAVTTLEDLWELKKHSDFLLTGEEEALQGDLEIIKYDRDTERKAAQYIKDENLKEITAAWLRRNIKLGGVPEGNVGGEEGKPQETDAETLSDQQLFTELVERLKPYAEGEKTLKDTEGNKMIISLAENEIRFKYDGRSGKIIPEKIKQITTELKSKFPQLFEESTVDKPRNEKKGGSPRGSGQEVLKTSLRDQARRALEEIPKVKAEKVRWAKQCFEDQTTAGLITDGQYQSLLAHLEKLSNEASLREAFEEGKQKGKEGRLRGILHKLEDLKKAEFKPENGGRRTQEKTGKTHEGTSAETTVVRDYETLDQALPKLIRKQCVGVVSEGLGPFVSFANSVKGLTLRQVIENPKYGVEAVAEKFTPKIEQLLPQSWKPKERSTFALEFALREIRDSFE